MLVDSLETPFDRTQPDPVAPRPALDERDVLSQVSVISSRDLGDRVVRDLKLRIALNSTRSLRMGVGLVSRIYLWLWVSAKIRAKRRRSNVPCRAMTAC